MHFIHPPPPRLIFVCNKKILWLFDDTYNEVSNPNQDGGKVSSLSSCCWGIGGYFFFLCLFPFMSRCIPFPSSLIIALASFYYFFVPVLGNLPQILLSEPLLFPSVIYLITFQTSQFVYETRLLKAWACFFKSGQTLWTLYPFTKPTNPWSSGLNEMYKNIRLSTTQHNQKKCDIWLWNISYVALGKIYFLNYIFA